MVEIPGLSFVESEDENLEDDIAEIAAEDDDQGWETVSSEARDDILVVDEKETDKSAKEEQELVRDDEDSHLASQQEIQTDSMVMAGMPDHAKEEALEVPLAAVVIQKVTGSATTSETPQVLQAGEEAAYLAQLLGLQESKSTAPPQALPKESDSSSDAESGEGSVESSSSSENDPEAKEEEESVASSSSPGPALIDEVDDDDDPFPKAKSNGPLHALSNLWKTQHELDIPLPKDTTDMQIGDGADVRRIGSVHGLVGDVVLVRADTSGDYRVLDTGSFLVVQNDEIISAATKKPEEPMHVPDEKGDPLFLDDEEDLQPADKTVSGEGLSEQPQAKWRVLGEVFETLGPVTGPVYSLRLSPNNVGLINVLNIGRPIYYCPDPIYSNFVFTQPLQALKGSDASNLYDEEVAEEELEFSDDEKELQHKRSKKRKKRGGNDFSATPKVHIENKANGNGVETTRADTIDPEIDLLDYSGAVPGDDDYQILQRPTETPRVYQTAPGPETSSFRPQQEDSGDSKGRKRRDRKNREKNRRNGSQPATFSAVQITEENPFLPPYSPQSMPPNSQSLPGRLPFPGKGNNLESQQIRKGNVRGKGMGYGNRGRGQDRSDGRHGQMPEFPTLPTYKGEQNSYGTRPQSSSAYVNGVFQGTPFSYSSSSQGVPDPIRPAGHFNPRFFPQAAVSMPYQTPMVPSYSNQDQGRASSNQPSPYPYSTPQQVSYGMPQFNQYDSQNTFQPAPLGGNMNAYSSYTRVGPYHQTQHAQYMPDQQTYPTWAQQMATGQSISAPNGHGQQSVPPSLPLSIPPQPPRFEPSPSPTVGGQQPIIEGLPRTLGVHNARPTNDPRASLAQRVPATLVARSPVAPVPNLSTPPQSTTNEGGTVSKPSSTPALGGSYGVASRSGGGASEIAQQLARLQQLQAKRTL